MGQPEASAAKTEGGTITPPYVRRVENRKGAYPGEFVQVRPLRMLHMGIEGKTEKCLVPIVWKRILNPGVTDLNGVPSNQANNVLTQVECIGLIWGQYVGRPDELVTTTRFVLPLSEYLNLQIGLVEI